MKMSVNNIIKRIMSDADIHHNISTLGMKLPDAPEEAPNIIFWDTCAMLIEDFIEVWKYEPRNDSGNRNLCGCARKVICTADDFKKDNGYNGRSYIDAYRRWMSYAEAKKLGIIDKQVPGITSDGACMEHDLYHVYQHGRMGATLYWNKYWDSKNSGFYFKYDAEELEEKETHELSKIADDISAFNEAVECMLKILPDALKCAYEDWEAQDKEDKRKDALGYNKTLGALLEDNNEQIKRLAKGIKRELNK